ncbi:MAG: precorrin-3B C(17)-methyltransferase [Pseudomonadota bacterium]
MAVTPIVVALNAAGEATANRVADLLDCPLHGRADRTRAETTFPNALVHIRDLFAAGHPVIGICASGILIRAVAPLLGDKTTEPPVLSVSDDGSVVVPLLGGHRGANRLARRIAEGLDGKAAVTTAGDVALGVALDEPPVGWALANPQDAKGAMARLLAGAGAAVTGDDAAGADWLADLPSGDAVTLACTMAPHDPAQATLTFHPKRATLGVGASRGCPPEELIELVDGMLADASIAPKALRGIFTADLKGDEAAMIALARHLDQPLHLFTAAELEAQTPRTETPSEVVFAEIGSHGVAENAALAGGGPDAILAVPKRKTAMATAALAIAPAPITDLRGRSRGRLSIVSIGPGQSAWRTPEASRMVAEADELVGYSLYLDLLGPLAAGKPRADFPLGGEEARCRHALERAGEGRNVALVCSGDVGIYAMAALVYELLDHGDLSADAKRVEVHCTPGVSALQAAASRAGAPLGHDFCAISLSDLLTPRADIVRRLKAAAAGDFVIAFYNPVSKRRRTLLTEARDILLDHRPADTPVLLASSLGRPDEDVRLRRLDALEVDEVDMLTVVLVGSSHSRVVQTADGPRLYTPRGYARKMAGGDLAEARA